MTAPATNPSRPGARRRRLGARPPGLTRTSASSRSTSTRPPTTRATCQAPSASTGRRSSTTAVCRDLASRDAARGAAARRRRQRRHADRLLRRQRQLVRRVGVLAAEVPGPRQRPSARRRTQEDRGRRTAADAGRTDSPARQHHAPLLARPAGAAHVPRRRHCARSTSPSAVLVDVRSPAEYVGELAAPEHLPQERAQRKGHIPGAVNVPVGQGRRGGRHLQVRRGARVALYAARA